MSSSPGDRPLLGPIIGTAIFLIVGPGTVLGLVPHLLSGWIVQAPLCGWRGFRWIGATLVIAATPLFIDFILRFVREGRGTPAPVAPTQYLVVGGPFRYVRNPGYVAVLSILLGQGLLFGSAGILLWAACVAMAFHLFVVFYEEPTLLRQFGAQYAVYRRHVPRWIPRLRPAPLSDLRASKDDA